MTQFNSETNQLDLYSDCRYLCGLDETADTTSYPIKAFTRNANFALDKVTSFILKTDGWWQYDDTNNSGELLDVSTALVSGTQKYSLVVTWLKIGRVRVKDSGGNWVILEQVERRALNNAQLNASSGDPRGYDLLGNYIYLYPAPNYSVSAGLEVQFQRGNSYFTNSDTTKAPGFASPFHRLISMYAALDFCLINGLSDRAANLANLIGTPPDLDNNQAGSGMVKELIDHYSRRNSDAKISLQPVHDDYGALGLSPGTGVYPTNLNPYGF